MGLLVSDGRFRVVVVGGGSRRAGMVLLSSWATTQHPPGRAVTPRTPRRARADRGGEEREVGGDLGPATEWACRRP
jgi:hypothetical protein